MKAILGNLYYNHLIPKSNKNIISAIFYLISHKIIPSWKRIVNYMIFYQYARLNYN